MTRKEQAVYDGVVRLAPASYLAFRDRFPLLVRWVLDLVVFVVVFSVAAIVLTVVMVVFHGART